MPKKKFEEQRYSSVNAVVLRDAAAVGRTSPRGERSPAEASAQVEAAPMPGPQAAAAPVAVAEPRKPAKVVPMPERAATTPGRGKLTEGKMKRFRLALEEDLQVEDALANIRRRCRQRVTLSHVARVACELLVRLEEDIVEELERNPLPSPPSTQDTVAYAAYDEEVLKRLRRVYRRARA